MRNKYLNTKEILELFDLTEGNLIKYFGPKKTVYNMKNFSIGKIKKGDTVLLLKADLRKVEIKKRTFMSYISPKYNDIIEKIIDKKIKYYRKNRKLCLDGTEKTKFGGTKLFFSKIHGTEYPIYSGTVTILFGSTKGKINFTNVTLEKISEDFGVKICA